MLYEVITEAGGAPEKGREGDTMKGPVDLIFYVLAALTVGSAILVAILPNIIYAAVALLFTFGGVAGLYVLLSADFLAATQVLVYRNNFV